MAEQSRKIEKFNKENPKYLKSAKKVDDFLNNAESIVANSGYGTESQQKAFRNNEYPKFLVLQQELDTINKSYGEKIEQSWSTVKEGS
jgi:hypothetical protein